MFLRPHHFQQAENHQENQLKAWGRAHQGNYWGFLNLEIDEEALRRGVVALTAGCGIFPDGTYFFFQGAQTAPAPLTVGHFKQAAKIFLATPLVTTGREHIIFNENTASLARYQSLELDIDDLNAMAVGQATIQVGKLRLRLMLESELTADWTALGVVHVVERRKDETLLTDKNYIPPTLNCHTNPRLTSYLSDLLGLLQQRSQLLSQHLTEAGRAGVSEILDFLLLQLLNRYHGFTHHVSHQTLVHPEQIFVEWLKLSSDLTTFSTDRTLGKNIPQYHHDDLDGSFRPLLQQLRQQLSIIIEENVIKIEFIHKSHGLYIASISDPQILVDFDFVLAVSANVPSDTIRHHFPAKAKFSPVNKIRDLVQLQLPGIPLHGMSVAPRALPYHSGYTYFELEKTGDLWQNMEKSSAFALHVAGDFPDLKLEFWAIRNS